jgi:hypothetical protein
MSKLARTLALVAMLAAMAVPAMTAVAQAHVADQAVDRQVTSTQQAAADTAHRRQLAQDRSYSTWSSSDTNAPAPAGQSDRAGWLAPALTGLALVVALIAGVTVIAARRANRVQRAGQTA